MRFLDFAEFNVSAGNGGDGFVSFDPFAKGKPNGGNGGNGGNIYFTSKKNINSLMDLKYNKFYKAQDGIKGGAKLCNGRNGHDLILFIPVGSTIYNEKKQKLVEFTKDNQTILIAKGGKGGRGNGKFAKEWRDNPNKCEKGEIGESMNISIEIKVLADVGFVGLPNAGKSTLLNVISNSKPEIADYPFTTIKPHLGICKDSYNRSFVVADLPGLIEGANLGKGLGVEFLKYIEKCRIICHVIDMSGNYGQEDVIKNYELIRKELKSYNLMLDKKPEIIVANKIDLESAQYNLLKFSKRYSNKNILLISGKKQKNVNTLLNILGDQLETLNN
ncbi:GTPase ObgE [Spiroplasma corruscae]|uniref:GTPase Obg n=1 Tax=Spiroplasma corruscae TaxID=216934 RepID=A0A222EQB0_9MOLU|nr:GTPase ObgE [Spiroplasma corruscae]ASP28745.1 GTPase ObgE [Spiroplasma corruscae]